MQAVTYIIRVGSDKLLGCSINYVQAKPSWGRPSSNILTLLLASPEGICVNNECSHVQGGGSKSIFFWLFAASS
jgi:hypothetical protein